MPHSRSRRVVRADVDPAEIALPQQLPGQVVRVEALRAEERDHHLAVGRRRGVGVGRLHVPLLFRRPLRRRCAPRAILPLSRSRQISFHCCAVRSSEAVAATEQTALERRIRRVLLTAVVTKIRSVPDDRARMRQAGDGRLPQDTGALRGIPTGGKILVPSADARGGGSAKRRPVLRGSSDRNQEQQRAMAHFGASKTTFPPTTVSSASMSLISSTGQLRKSFEITTMSASLPGSIDPLIFSSNDR